MTQDARNSLPDSPGRSPMATWAALTAVLLAAWPAFAWFGHHNHGAAGLQASVVAGVVCWIGASAALFLVALLQGPLAVHGTIAGIFFRMWLPLGTGVLLDNMNRPLAEAGVFGMILLYYLVALAVEMPLSLRLVRPTRVTSAS